VKHIAVRLIQEIPMAAVGLQCASAVKFLKLAIGARQLRHLEIGCRDAFFSNPASSGIIDDREWYTADCQEDFLAAILPVHWTPVLRSSISGRYLDHRKRFAESSSRSWLRRQALH
jgi:hypothetical protein